MPTTTAVHLGLSIDRSPRDVYEFVARPENLPRWAKGLGGAIANVHGEWFVSSPMGKVKIRFAERNEHGVLDHFLTEASGAVVGIPMRVVPNGDGSELIFTLFRPALETDEDFEADRAAVERDLAELKRLLEAGSG